MNAREHGRPRPALSPGTIAVRLSCASLRLSCTGLVTGFGLQAFVNMASSLQLIPTKGMTLPLISYGGSSAMAVALGMGMLLALTRRRHHGDVP